MPTGTIIALIAFIPLSVGIGGVVAVIMHAMRWPANVQTAQWKRLDMLLNYVTIVASGVSLILSIVLIMRPLDSALTNVIDLPIVGKVGLLLDSLSVYFVFVVNIIAFVASWSSTHYQVEYSHANRWRTPLLFITLVNIFHFTMVVVPMVDNLIVLWIAIEATTLVSTLLVVFNGTRNSWEAAWKYLIITSTGIIFALLGTMFLANSAKGLLSPTSDDPNNIMNWTFLMQHAKDLTPEFVTLSFLFIVVGYGTKAGLAPMHTWLPDGHGEAPAPISALLSGVLLKSALYAILRFYTLTNVRLGNAQFTSEVLLGAGLLSLIVAAPFILGRKPGDEKEGQEGKFKRVLAYHSVEHMGIITFGIGIGGPIALFGALLHVLNHAVTKSLMFLSFGDVMRRYATRNISQEQITGILRAMPVTGALLALGGLALVGMPPANIFMSELLILWGAVSHLLTPAASAAALSTPVYSPAVLIGVIALFLLSTTLIFYGLVKHLGRLVLHESPGKLRFKENLWDLAPLLFLMAIIVVFGVWIWPPLSSLITASVAIVQQ